MHSTTGPPAVNRIAEMEQGEITRRCIRSSGTPAAAARIALIGSACETATIVSPGWSATRASTASMARTDISAKDSPPGNRNPPGQRCTVGHSRARYSRARGFSVHVPTSTSMRPGAVRTRSPRARAMGAAVSRVRSSGEA